jgi:heme-degrading monooxygenase HmoA
MNHWHNKPIPHSDYYAVIFCSTKSDDLEGYPEMDALLLDTAMQQPGFLGYESAGNSAAGIFISYWQDEDSIKAWRADAMHQTGIKHGMERWYKRYLSQVCKVVRSHEMEKDL